MICLVSLVVEEAAFSQKHLRCLGSRLVVCGRRGCKGKEKERKGKEGKGMSGKRSRWRSASLAARTAADGVGAGNGWGEEAAGDERAWLRGRLRTGNGCETARTAADGVGATEWLEMGGEKKPLVMSELGCADGCGRRGCQWVAGNGWGGEAAGDQRAWLRGRLRTATEWLLMGGKIGRENWWGEEAAGDERAWLRGRLRTANGCGELCGRLRTAWLQRSGWKWVGRRSRWRSASLAARTAADGKWVGRIARTAADGVGAREWLEMGGEKKPLVMSELGCTDSCGREMGAENCADGCGRRGCNGVAGKCWKWVGRRSRWWWASLAARTAAAGKWVRRTVELCGRLRTAWVPGSGWKWVGRRSRWRSASLPIHGRLRTGNGAENSADGCGRRGCKGVAGNGWGEEAAGDERAWLRGRLRMANGCGELRGRLRTAWVQRSGWKWVGRRSRWRSASLAARTAADGKWVGRIARTAADGVGAREWLEMGGETKPLEISELGCADGCGREMGAENCADGCARRGCNGVPGKGEKGAGDEWAWLPADGKWVRRTARMAADGVGSTEWLEMGGEKKPLEISELGCAAAADGKLVGRIARTAADGVGAREWLEMSGEKSRWRSASLAAQTAADGKWLRRIARTAADGVGAKEWLEMGGEKPLEISELVCADGCGREMGAENCADGCDGVGAREWLEMGGEMKPLVISEGGCADGCGRQMGGENSADSCGRRGCKGLVGNGWGEEAAGDERAWLRGRLQTANGWGELRGRLRTAWVPGEWLEMGGEKKPLGMSELGCADGCGRERGAENCADGCGQRGCKGVAGNG